MYLLKSTLTLFYPGLFAIIQNNQAEMLVFFIQIQEEHDHVKHVFIKVWHQAFGAVAVLLNLCLVKLAFTLSTKSPETISGTIAAMYRVQSYCLG